MWNGEKNPKDLEARHYNRSASGWITRKVELTNIDDAHSG